MGTTFQLETEENVKPRKLYIHHVKTEKTKPVFVLSNRSRIRSGVHFVPFIILVVYMIFEKEKKKEKLQNSGFRKF